MVIFHCYVSSPEGNPFPQFSTSPWTDELVTWSFAEEKGGFAQPEAGLWLRVRHCGPSKLQGLEMIKYWLVVWNMFYFPFHIWVVILPID